MECRQVFARVDWGPTIFPSQVEHVGMGVSDNHGGYAVAIHRFERLKLSVDWLSPDYNTVLRM